LIRNRLQDELLELQEKMHKTIIFVSHDLDEALKIGNKIAIMDQARIVQYGEPEDIVRNPANEYVADFVSHMNPLNVLKGRTLMTTTSDIPKIGDALKLDRTGYWQLAISDDQVPVSAKYNGIEADIVAYETGDDVGLIEDNQFVMASPDIMLREVIEIRHKSCSPVLFVENGKLVGMIGDDEIFKGFLH
jgi:glycine betaine/proline transport system ATP-binding protein